MNREQLIELLRYSSPKSIMVVTHKNQVIEIYCPFKVMVINDVGNLKKGSLERVDSVKLSYLVKTVYIIKGKAYYYYHFTIIID